MTRGEAMPSSMRAACWGPENATAPSASFVCYARSAASVGAGRASPETSSRSIRRAHINIGPSSGELIERRVYRIGAHATHVLVARVGPSGKNCLESSGLAGRRQPTTSHGSRGRGAAHINIDD